MSSAIVPVYARADVTFERGEGCWLTTTNGERYLDFGAGIAVNSLGHSHPHLVETLISQGRKLWHTSNLFQMPEGERLAQRLVEATFADLVFFANSGAEANEAAIKMARKRHAVRRPSRAVPYPHLRGRVSWPHARHARRRRPGKYLEGFGPKVDGLRPDPDHRSRRRRGGDRPRDGRDHDRADPGRGRRARRRPRVPQGLARNLRRARVCC